MPRSASPRLESRTRSTRQSTAPLAACSKAVCTIARAGELAHTSCRRDGGRQAGVLERSEAQKPSSSSRLQAQGSACCPLAKRRDRMAAHSCGRLNSRSLGVQSFGKLGDGNGLERQDGIANADGLGMWNAELDCSEELFRDAIGIERPCAGTVVDWNIGFVPPAIRGDEADAARHVLR